jgi:hypothetical protein
LVVHNLLRRQHLRRPALVHHRVWRRQLRLQQRSLELLAEPLLIFFEAVHCTSVNANSQALSDSINLS